MSRDEARLHSPFPSALIRKVTRARRERTWNKQRERQREASGEIVKKTIERARQGPPAHVLAKMTPRQRHLDKVSRSSISEVGYIGWAKKQLGWKLKNPNPWEAEDGKPEDEERLMAMEEKIRQENERRAAAAAKLDLEVATTQNPSVNPSTR